MYTKPCARADRGCQRLVRGLGPRTLARHRFCSHTCSAKARVESGTWHPPSIPADERRRRGLLGGAASAEIRRAKAMRNAARQAVSVIPEDIADTLTREQLALVSTLVTRAWREGRKVGYEAGYHRRRSELRAFVEQARKDRAA